MQQHATQQNTTQHNTHQAVQRCPNSSPLRDGPSNIGRAAAATRSPASAEASSVTFTESYLATSATLLAIGGPSERVVMLLSTEAV